MPKNDDNRYDLRGTMLEEGNLVATATGFAHVSLARITRILPTMIEVEIIDNRFPAWIGGKHKRYPKDLLYVGYE